MNALSWLSTIPLKIGPSVFKLLPHKTVRVICKCAEAAPLSWFEKIIRHLLQSKYQAVLGEKFDTDLFKELVEISEDTAAAWQRQRRFFIENGIPLPETEGSIDTTDKIENSESLED